MDRYGMRFDQEPLQEPALCLLPRIVGIRFLTTRIRCQVSQPGCVGENGFAWRMTERKEPTYLADL